MHRRSSFPFLFLLVFLFLLRGPCAASPIQDRADRFLKLANAGYQALFRVNSEAQWLAVTDVTPEHDAAVAATGKAYAAFNGNPVIITEARHLLVHEKELTPLSVRQLKQLLLNAAEGPMTNPDLVAKRVEAETKQASILNSFEFNLNGQKITANEIDNKLQRSTDLEERKAVWEASKESGPALKPNLVVLRDLRNGVAREMKYPDYFSLEVSSYGMTTDEMLKMLDDWIATLRPLYLQLHTWAKYKLAEKYHQPVPKKFRHTGSTIGGHKNGPIWLKPLTSTNTSRAAARLGLSRRQSNSIPALDSLPYRKVSGRNRICIGCRRPRYARKRLTLRAGISIWRTTSARSRISNRTRAGFSPRITSSVMDITLKPTPDRKFPTSFERALPPDFTRRCAN